MFFVQKKVFSAWPVIHADLCFVKKSLLWLGFELWPFGLPVEQNKSLLRGVVNRVERLDAKLWLQKSIKKELMRPIIEF